MDSDSWTSYVSVRVPTTYAKGDDMAIEGVSSIESSGRRLGLTPLERHTVALIASGYSSEEMALMFGISETVLQQQINHICRKLRVSNELELVLLVLDGRLVDRQ